MNGTPSQITNAIDRQQTSANPSYGNTVIRGAKSHVVFAGLDWFKAAGPCGEGDQYRIERLLNHTFGPSVVCGGKWQYKYRRKWADSVQLMWRLPEGDDDTGGLCVDVPGAALNSLPLGRMLRLVHVLSQGNHCTRIDLRADFKADEVGLIDAIHTSCLAGELCKARRWKPEEPRTNNGEFLGRGVNIGARGSNGSGRYVRVYDKGLQTQTQVTGEWERFEVEFTGDVAKKVGMAIAAFGRDVDGACQATKQQFSQTIMEFIYGAVDFREKNGQRELNRRPRVAWWQKLIDGVQLVTVKQDRSPTSFESFTNWIRTGVAPTLFDMASASGQSVEQVLKSLVGNNVRVKIEPEKRPIVHQYLKHLKMSDEAGRVSSDVGR